jgi:sugar/nucleoside kinase (ribokinase family)
MVDALGDDWSASLIQSEFITYGVSTAHIRRVAHCGSSIATVLVNTRSGDRAIMYCPGTVPELRSSDIGAHMFERCEMIHMNGRHFDACIRACEIAKVRGIPISFDGGAQRFSPKMRELVRASTLCIVASDFAQQYTGKKTAQAAAAILIEEGPEVVVVTEGRDGSWIQCKTGESFRQQAFITDSTIDTTGCGDSYHGAFIFGTVCRVGVRATAAFASAVAAINSCALGGRAGLPTYYTARAFLSLNADKSIMSQL